MSKPRKLSKCSPVTDVRSANTDRISELPDEILYSILSNLTLRDSVRTGVLSRRWKGVSNSLPILKFDWFNMFSTGQSHELLVADEHPCRFNQERFVTAVTQYIESYRGTSLRSFTVTFCLSRAFSFCIDQWVCFATSMGVKRLFLKFNCSRGFLVPRAEQNYILSSRLVEEAIFTRHFSFLETLDLTCLSLAVYDLHKMFSYLTKLEDLSFRNCTLPEKLCLGSLLYLKKFRLSYCIGIKEIEFSNANLLNVKCDCFDMVTFNLSGVPNLKKLSHSTNRDGMLQVFHHVPGQLPVLEKLSVFTRFDWVKNVPEHITTFSSVTRLKLALMMKLKFDMLKLVSILKAFPLLRTLRLAVNCLKDHEPKTPQPGPGEYVHKHLQVAEIAILDDISSLFEFGKYLLKHASSLERLTMLQNSSTTSWSEEERQTIYEKLLEYSKGVKLCVW